MENKDSQSRASETQIVVLQKDIEHLQYVIGERLDDIKLIHGRIDQHLQSDLDFHENVRKKISDKFEVFDDRIRHLERWKWAAWGAMIIVGTLLGYKYNLPFSLF